MEKKAGYCFKIIYSKKAYLVNLAYQLNEIYAVLKQNNAVTCD